MSYRFLPDLVPPAAPGRASPAAWPWKNILRRSGARHRAHPCHLCEGSFCLNGMMMTGQEAIGGLYSMLYGAFPDLAVRVDSAEASANAVTLEVRITGTHRGPWQGVPVTGRPIDLPLAALFPFDAEDRLIGERVYFDGAALMTQLGLLPPASAARSASPHPLPKSLPSTGPQAVAPPGQGGKGARWSISRAGSSRWPGACWLPPPASSRRRLVDRPRSSSRAAARQRPARRHRLSHHRHRRARRAKYLLEEEVIRDREMRHAAEARRSSQVRVHHPHHVLQERW
jgi:predicted ester cyclase